MNPHNNNLDRSEMINSPAPGTPDRTRKADGSMLYSPENYPRSMVNDDGAKSQFGTNSRAPGNLGYSQMPLPKAPEEEEYGGVDEHGNIHLKEKTSKRKLSEKKKLEESAFKPVEPGKAEQINIHLKPEKHVEEAHGVDESTGMVTYMELFKFASKCERIMVIFATLFSIMAGVLIGQMPDVIGDSATALGTKTGNAIVNAAREIVWKALGYGCGAAFCGITGKYFWSKVSSSLERSIRFKFFHAILLKDCSWYDILSSEKITGMYNMDGNAYVKALGTANNQLNFAMGQCLAGIVLSLSTHVIFMLISCALLPLILIGLIGMAWALGAGVQISKASYIKAGADSEQAIIGIRTVKSLNGEEHEIESYKESIEQARKTLVKFGWMQGAAFGLLFFSIYMNYGVGLWAGGKLIHDQRENPNTYKPTTTEDVITTFFAVLTAFMAAGSIAPSLEHITKGREAAYAIYKIIEGVPVIKENDDTKIRPVDGEVHGKFEFRNVSFNYPSRPTVQILKNLSLTIPRGKKVAFVGETGCGKSTTIQLIERFYDPLEGEILLDGKNLKDYNLTQLRKFMGYVGQEPVLFGMSIKENLLLAKPKATDAEIDDVLKKSNCTQFVNQLEHGVDTYCGSGGSQLSGGQKQRVAIARAMLLNPPILLLDESTSALDRKNEKEIQETLDEFSKERTTVLIAHRLSTIRNADVIFVLQDGKVLESGTHEDLMTSEPNPRHLYWKLVRQQEIHHEEEAKLVTDSVHEDEAETDHEGVTETDHLKRNSYSYNDPTGQGMQGAHAQVQQKAAGHTTKYAIDKARKDDQMKVAAHTNYNHDDEKASLRVHSNVRDHKANLEKNTAHAGIGYQNISGGMHSFHEGNNSSNINRTSSLIPTTTVTTAQGEEVAVPYGKLWADIGPDKCIAIFTWLACVGMGCLQPLVGYSLGETTDVLVKLQLGVPDKIDDLNQVLYKYIGLAFAAFVGSTLEKGGQTFVGNNLTNRVRQKFYAKLLYHDIAFFDDPDNNAGEIAANLESDTKYMNSLLTDIMGVIIKNASTILIAVFLAFSTSWRMSLCVLAVIPLMFVNGMIQGKARMAMGEGEAVGSSIVQECVNNLKTVRAMNTLDVTMMRFDKLLEDKQPTNKLMIFEAVFYGLGQSIMLFIIAFLYYVGALFMRDNGLSFGDFNKALMTLIFAGMAMGQASQFAGDSVQAGLSCVHIYSFLDQKKMIKEPRVPETIQKFTGRIEFKNATFRYPTRKDYIFRKMNCVINAGEDVAFCGPSGSGKSTIIQLLLRFYDLTSGEILLDGINIKQLALKDLRQMFGLVGQEPFLFNMSIYDNIKYTTYEATMDEIKDAAVISNAIDFIEKDEGFAVEDKDEATGYDRFVGVKGSKLSGGQKQRLAIARAVLRKPRAYLYDEATSALDSKSEQIVQTALNRLSENKTSISIAHRISTIQDCDTIYVIGDKVIKEYGTFDELMHMQGLFWKLNQDL